MANFDKALEAMKKAYEANKNNNKAESSCPCCLLCCGVGSGI
ncbi:hypothetical protein [Campylobacter helveticus]|nr:hypothetical protein [Campylobacter helveticus]